MYIHRGNINLIETRWAS